MLNWFKKDIKTTVFLIGLPLFFIIISYFFFEKGYGKHLEYKFYDMLIKNNNFPDKAQDVIIVAVDDESFQTLDMQWPFPREFYSRLIDNLKEAGAKQIVFDIEFAEGVDSLIDEKIGVSAKNHGNVVFAGKIYQTRDNNFVRTTILPPVKEITKHDDVWGIVNMASDEDGFVRRYPLFHRIQKDLYFSLGMTSILNLPEYKGQEITFENQHLKLKNLNIPFYLNNISYLNYFGKPKTFKHISFSSVIDDSSLTLPMEEFFPINDFYFLKSSQVFKDKIVLIGATVDELKDNFHTPLNTQAALMAGVEIHANFIQMALNQNFITTIPIFVFYILLTVLMILLSYLINSLKPHISIIFVVIIVAVYIFTAYLLLNHYRMIIPYIILPVNILILYIASLINHYMKENKEKKAIRKTFQHYMAPGLVKELLKSPDKLKYGGSNQELTVLFSDIRSFTTYTESHDVQDTVTMLREYLTEMVNVIIANQGTLDKFVGDEIMALYNTPVTTKYHALNACKTAMEMMDKLWALQDKWKSQGKDIIDIGIGVNTGFAVVGNLGSEQIFDYTAIGDTINLGARLESLNKNYPLKRHTIISEFTLEHVKDYVVVNYLDAVIVKGKTKPIKIYELVEITHLPEDF